MLIGGSATGDAFRADDVGRRGKLEEQVDEKDRQQRSGYDGDQ